MKTRQVHKFLLHRRGRFEIKKTENEKGSKWKIIQLFRATIYDTRNSGQWFNLLHQKIAPFSFGTVAPVECRLFHWIQISLPITKRQNESLVIIFHALSLVSWLNQNKTEASFFVLKVWNLLCMLTSAEVISLGKKIIHAIEFNDPYAHSRINVTFVELSRTSKMCWPG